jgi:PAS domain S-box-containing protein
VDARLLRLFLGESQSTLYQVTHLETLQAGLAQLRQEEFDLILCDLSLPDSHDLDTFRQLHNQAPDIPSIVLSGSDDENLAVQAVREGAQDYLVKGRVEAHGLMRAISYALERHRAERALQESEQHYKRLLESITDYVYTVDIEAGQPVRSVHGPGCITITGFSPDELGGASDLWQLMVPDEDRPAVLARVQEVLAGKSPSPLEHRIIHKSGQLRWVRHTFVPGRNEEGVLVSYDGLISHITERKQAEEKLVKSEAFYHSLVENLPQNIFRKDREERFTFANQRFCNLLGKSLEEIIGKTDFDFYTPELASKFQRDDRWVIETGRSFETVEENKSATGGKIYVQVVKTPIYDAHSEILGTQCIFWDITERKQFEERLQNANAELARNEQALRKSNEALRAAQMQLIQAEKMESIGTLAAGVAHEVKNPLAILMMGLNYLAKKLQGSDEHIASVVKEMREAIQRADSITRELLDFASNRQLAIQPEHLNDLIQETLRLLRHALKEKQIELREEYASDLPRIGVDKRQIQQVFVNLFMNAVHAIPPGGGTITIRTFCKELTEAAHFEGSRRADRMWVGDTVVVAEVEDTGTGIPEEYLLKIFDPFFTTKPTGLGTGLGLSVSKKIIELHGGTLSIKNIEGSGVRVTLTLKAYKR